MRAYTLDQRLIAKIICAIVLASLIMLPHAAHAAGNAHFEFRPHCESGADSSAMFGGPMPTSDQMIDMGTGAPCESFEVQTPDSVQTNVLEEGDILDIDLIINNPDKRPISRFRAWVMYDPVALEGVEIAIAPIFPIPTPGENTFVANEGHIKIAGTATQPVTDEKIVVARIRLKVLQVTSSATPLTFAEVIDDMDSRTGIYEQSGADETNLHVPRPGFLYVRFDQNSATAGGSSSMSSETTVSSASSSTSSIPVVQNTMFNQLQVQGLRVTTEGSSVFLAWDALPSSELVGYNMYYGTTMGSYIQRRSVEGSATSITIRSLPVGTTYYFAVRGVNAAGTESDFSQEVGISVGNPRTSTSPLNANSLPTQTPGTDGNVAGETGLSSILLVFLIISAVTGTALAFRRQWYVPHA
jgi:hypothetical protein